MDALGGQPGDEPFVQPDPAAFSAAVTSRPNASLALWACSVHISAARQWAGAPADGEPYLPPMSAEGIYRMRGHLLDWDLFRRLRKRAQARLEAGHDDGAVADYQAALRLVRGPVLTPLRPGGYAWLTNPDQQHDTHIPGVVTDTAHVLVNLALAQDDLALARWATEVALLVDEHRSLDRPWST